MLGSLCSADPQDSAIIHVEEYSYQGMDRPGRITLLQKPYGWSGKMLLPLGNELLKISMTPTWTEEGTTMELAIEGVEVEEAFGDDYQKDNERITEIFRKETFNPLENRSLLIPWNASERVIFGDIAFRISCPKLECKTAPVFPLVVDEAGNAIKGTVRLIVYIKGDGHVYQTVVSTSDDDRLNKAAKEAMEKAVYAPIDIDGKPFSTSYKFSAVFGGE